MHRLYRYVGPAAIAEAVRGDAAGRAIRSQGDLRDAVAGLGGARGTVLVVTFVVDALGTLRIADRSSEHVACAGGLPVMTAGELGIAGGAAPWIETASNQSTGFCPESGSFPALKQALDDAGIGPPDGWSSSFEFRRCICGVTTLVKEDEFECVECGAGLPLEWNFDRTRCRRALVRSRAAVWIIDTTEEASQSDQDRIGVVIRDDHVLVTLADGAGGSAGGAGCAEQSVTALASSVVSTPENAVSAVRGLDTWLASHGRGETTVVVASASDTGVVVGASVGDSVAWARTRGRWFELTEAQRHKPLVGRGEARPEPFGPHRDVDALLVASDGLAKYAKWPDIAAAIERDDTELPWQLVDLARLPSAALHDDVSIVLVRRSAPT